MFTDIRANGKADVVIFRTFDISIFPVRVNYMANPFVNSTIIPLGTKNI